MAHVCYKANSDVCHTAAILDAAQRSVQQPAHNHRRCINLPFTQSFFALRDVIRIPTPSP